MNDIVKASGVTQTSRGLGAPTPLSGGTPSGSVLAERGLPVASSSYKFHFEMSQKMLMAASRRDRHLQAWAVIFDSSPVEFESLFKNEYARATGFNHKFTKIVPITYTLDKSIYQALPFPGRLPPSDMSQVEERAYESLKDYANLELPDSKDHKEMIDRQLGWAVQFLSSANLEGKDEQKILELIEKFHQAVRMTGRLDSQGLWEMSQAFSGNQILYIGLPFDKAKRSLDEYLLIITIRMGDVERRKKEYKLSIEGFEKSKGETAKVVEGYDIDLEQIAAARQTMDAFLTPSEMVDGRIWPTGELRKNQAAQNAAQENETRVTKKFLAYLKNEGLTESEFRKRISDFIEDFRRFSLLLVKTSLMRYQTMIEFEIKRQVQDSNYYFRMYLEWTASLDTGKGGYSEEDLRNARRYRMQEKYAILNLLGDEILGIADSVAKTTAHESKRDIFVRKTAIVIRKRANALSEVLASDGPLVNEKEKVLALIQVRDAALEHQKLIGTPFERIIVDDFAKRATRESLKQMIRALILTAISLFPLGRAATFIGRIAVGAAKFSIAAVDTYDVIEAINDREFDLLFKNAGIANNVSSGWWVVLAVVGAGFSAADVFKSFKGGAAEAAAEIARNAESEASLARLMKQARYAALDVRVKDALRAGRVAEKKLIDALRDLRYAANSKLFMNGLGSVEAAVAMVRALDSLFRLGIHSSGAFVIVVRRAIARRSLIDEEIAFVMRFYDENSPRLLNPGQADNLVRDVLENVFEPALRAPNYDEVLKLVGKPLNKNVLKGDYIVVNLPNGHTILRRKAGETENLQKLVVDDAGLVQIGRRVRVRGDTKKFLREQLDILTNDKNHKCSFLVDRKIVKGKDGKAYEKAVWHTNTITIKKGKPQVGRFVDTSRDTEHYIVHVGHQAPFSSGKDEAFMLQDAEQNLWSGAVVEGKRASAEAHFTAVDIDGIILSTDSALMYERLGRLKVKGGVKNLPKITPPN